MTRQLPCPTCHKLLTWDKTNPHRPFCCERCRLIDLGEWAAEGHRIAGEPVYMDEDAIEFSPDDMN